MSQPNDYGQSDPRQSPREPETTPDGWGQPGYSAGSPYSQPTPPPPRTDPYGQPYPQSGYGHNPYAQPYGSQQADPYGLYGQDTYAPYGQDPYGTPSYPPVQPYGAPGYGYGYGSAEHPQASTVLLLGVGGFLFMPLWFIAWHLGGRARDEIRGGAPFRWDGNLKIGFLLGKVMGILTILGFVLSVLFMILAGGLMVLGG
ncbi:hypothetical protein [Tessaracoccus flavus]|uniref:hypothetical protein n=1 Tax=Tessaracoccus flavus TaxID=1610493 RepID=UPI00089C4C9D|nr:hypothetical protein [Tessaracoccus flavus]SDZ15228.1 hypothetical protein SAMN05428934_11255 [Tessaracoccus flavus]